MSDPRQVAGRRQASLSQRYLGGRGGRARAGSVRPFLPSP